MESVLCKSGYGFRPSNNDTKIPLMLLTVTELILYMDLLGRQQCLHAWQLMGSVSFRENGIMPNNASIHGFTWRKTENAAILEIISE